MKGPMLGMIVIFNRMVGPKWVRMAGKIVQVPKNQHQRYEASDVQCISHKVITPPGRYRFEKNDIINLIK